VCVAAHGRHKKGRTGLGIYQGKTVEKLLNYVFGYNECPLHALFFLSRFKLAWPVASKLNVNVRLRFCGIVWKLLEIGILK